MRKILNRDLVKNSVSVLILSNFRYFILHGLSYIPGEINFEKLEKCVLNKVYRLHVILYYIIGKPTLICGNRDILFLIEKTYAYNKKKKKSHTLL